MNAQGGEGDAGGKTPNHVAIAVRLRRYVDTPLLERPIWTWPALPFLFVCSAIFAGIAAVRRARDDAIRARENVGELAQQREVEVTGDVSKTARGPFLVCIGNVIAGGSGKSPLVRAFAVSLLARGDTVVIVSRGYGSVETVVAAAASLLPGDLAALSDEMREHFELLRIECGDAAMGRLFFAQGAARKVSLARVAILLERAGIVPSEAVALMDDGLQHFAVRPDFRVCVWSESLFDEAPHAAIPLGPYREGFFAGFGGFLTRFEAHVWSRLADGAPPAEATAFRARIASRLASRIVAPATRTAVGAIAHPAPPHFIARAQQTWLPTAASEMPPDPTSLLVAFRNGRAALVCGLGQPDAFVRAARDALASLGVSADVPLTTVLLPDHGTLTPAMCARLSQCEAIVLSAKDWFRLEPVLAPLLAPRRGHPWVLCVKVRLEDLRENPLEPASLLAPFRARVGAASSRTPSPDPV